MKLRNKFGKRLLSAVLASTLALSTAFSLSLPAFASSTQYNNPATPVGLGDDAWRVTYSSSGEYRFVMRINASCITDGTDTNDLASFNTRYGNGQAATMYQYPLYMQLGSNSGNLEGGKKHMIAAYNAANYADTNSNKSKNLCTDIQAEVDNLAGANKTWRTNHLKEFYGIVENPDDKLRGRNEENTNSIISHTGLHGSTYLEDILGYGLTAYNNGDINYYELRNLWYFYSRFAYAANQDFGYEQDANDGVGLGSALPEVFVTGASAVQKSNRRMYMMQSGYCIALYLAYGIEPYREMRGLSELGNLSNDTTRTKDTKDTESIAFWGTSTANKYKSFVVEKLFTDVLTDTGSNNNNLVAKNTLMSIPDYARLIWIYHSQSTNYRPDYLTEYCILCETGYSPKDSAGSGHPPSSLWWGLNMAVFFQHLVPATANGAERVGSNNKDGHTYAGWGYFEVCDGSKQEDDTPVLWQPAYPKYKNIATEVTYNAYLASNDNTDAWAHEIGRENPSNTVDAFGNNGHVMTDVVAFTYPVSEGDLIKSLSTPYAEATSFKANQNYLTTYVDSAITLSAPVASTQYKLKRFGYRITDAGGATVAKNGSTEISNYTTDISALTSTKNGADDTKPSGYGMGVIGSDIINAFNDSGLTYAERLYQRQSAACILAGKYKDEVTSTEGYLFIKDNTGKYVTVNGKRLTTGGYATMSGNKVTAYESFGNAGYPSAYRTLLGDKTYKATDVDEKSANYWYIEFLSEDIPAIFASGAWYLCPVVSVTNILVQFRADYVGSYSKDDTKMYQPVEIKKYLLAQNNDTNDFIKSGTLFTMIDNYAYDEFGSVATRGFYYYTNTSTSATNYSEDSTSFDFTKSSLFNSTYNLKGLYANSGHDKAAWSNRDLSLTLSDSYVGNKAKLHYIYVSHPTVMNVINSDNDTIYKTFANSNFAVNVQKYNVERGKVTGESSANISTALSRVGSLYATDSSWLSYDETTEMYMAIDSYGNIEYYKKDADGQKTIYGTLSYDDGDITYTQCCYPTGQDANASHEIIITDTNWLTYKYSRDGHRYKIPTGNPLNITENRDYCLNNGTVVGKVKVLTTGRRTEISYCMGDGTTVVCKAVIVKDTDNNTTITFKDSYGTVINTHSLDESGNDNTNLIGSCIGSIPSAYNTAFFESRGLNALFPKDSDGNSYIKGAKTFLNYGGLDYVTDLKYASEGVLRAQKASLNSKVGYGLDISKSYYRTHRLSALLTTANNKDELPKVEHRGYRQYYFTKLLSTYNTSVYVLKSTIFNNNTHSVPYIATWKYNDSALYDTRDNTGHITKMGLLTKYGLLSSIIQSNDTWLFFHSALTESDVKYRGFVRMGESEGKLSNKLLLKKLANNASRPGGILSLTTTTCVSSSDISKNIFLGSYTNLPLAFTQSSYDIPLKYQALVYMPTNKSIPSYASSIDVTEDAEHNEVFSLSSQYTNTSTANGDGIHKTNTSQVVLGVYPEVTMWAENDLTTNPNKSKPTNVSDYKEVITTGTKMRYVPAMTYATVSFSDIKNSISVNGTAVAYDTRAKLLAKSLGVESTQVLYSGSGINGAFDSTATATITGYAFDFQNKSLTQGYDLKKLWGNENYNAKDAAVQTMNNLLDKFEMDNEQALKIYNPVADKFNQYNFNKSTASKLTASAATADSLSYALEIKGGKLTQVTVYYTGKTTEGNTQALRILKYDFATDGSIASTSLLNTYGSNPSAMSNWYEAYNKFTAAEKSKIGVLNAQFNGTTKADMLEVLQAMKLYGTDKKLGNWFEHNTGETLPNGLTNSTGGIESYNEDCSVLLIRKYTANINCENRGTFTEQIPITMGPATQTDRNDYFSNGFKGFVTTHTCIKTTVKFNDTYTAGKVVKEDYNKHPTLDGSSEIKVDSAASAKKAEPDFIIGDVPISEATLG